MTRIPKKPPGRKPTTTLGKLRQVKGRILEQDLVVGKADEKRSKARDQLRELTREARKLEQQHAIDCLPQLLKYVHSHADNCDTADGGEVKPNTRCRRCMLLYLQKNPEAMANSRIQLRIFLNEDEDEECDCEEECGC